MAIVWRCPHCKHFNSERVAVCARCGFDARKGPRDWWIDYYDLQRKRRRERIGPSHRAAELRLAEVKRALAEGKVVKPLRQSRLTFSEFWEATYWPWAQTINSPGWLRRKEVIYRLHLKPEFGSLPLTSITRGDVKAFRQKRLKEGATPAEVNREVAVLRHALNYALKLELIEKNPAEKLGALREAAEDTWRVLTKEEAKRLLEALPEKLRHIFEFALATGLRMSNVLSLRWEQVDLNERKLVIPASESKSRKQLVLPLSRWAVSILEKQREISGGSEFVFPNARGAPYKDLRKSFHKALEKAGLPRMRMHDLRHTFASWAIQAGVDFRILKELLGHTTLQMALRYTHLDHSTLLSQVDRITSPWEHWNK